MAYTIFKHLLYYEFKDGQWDPRTLDRVYSRFQNINYFSIHSSELGVHILCYIGNSLNKSAELLIHYYLYEGKWYGGRLWRFMSDQKTRPQTLAIDSENKLHLLFSQDSRQVTHLYYSIYDPTTFLWEEPTIIHSSSPSTGYQLYVDSFGNVHSIWAERIDGQYGIKYLSKSAKDSSQEWREVVVYRSSNKLQSPTLLDNNAFYCFWEEEDFLYKIISRDSGLTWSVPEAILENLENNITLLNYTSCIKDKPNTWTLWGQKHPDIKLFGIDLFAEEPLLLSKNPYYIGEKSTDWNKMQREIPSLKRENSNLKSSLNDLSSQVEQLHSMVYNLQEQMQINEKALFNINARIRQLDFQSKQNHSRTSQTNYNVIPSKNEQKESDTQKTKFYVKPIIKEETKIKEEDESKPKLTSPIDIPNKDEEKAIETPLPSLNIPPVEESKYFEGESISQSRKLPKRVIIPTIENEDDLSEKEMDAERVSMGDTTILINPEDPSD